MLTALNLNTASSLLALYKTTLACENKKFRKYNFRSIFDPLNQIKSNQLFLAIETPGGKRILLKNIIAQQMIGKIGILIFILLSNVSAHYKRHLQTKYS